MTRVWKLRDWPMVDPAIFAGALLLYAAVLPLGLARVEGAPQVAAGITMDTSVRPAFFALLAMRLGQLLPLGDASLRANLASAVLCALAMALVARLCLVICSLLRPPTNARQERRDFAHEPLAGAGAALAAAFSLSTLDLGVCAGSAAATLVILAAAFLPGLAAALASTGRLVDLVFAERRALAAPGAIVFRGRLGRLRIGDHRCLVGALASRAAIFGIWRPGNPWRGRLLVKRDRAGGRGWGGGLAPGGDWDVRARSPGGGSDGLARDDGLDIAALRALHPASGPMGSGAGGIALSHRGHVRIRLRRASACCQPSRPGALGRDFRARRHRGVFASHGQLACIAAKKPTHALARPCLVARRGGFPGVSWHGRDGWSLSAGACAGPSSRSRNRPLRRKVVSSRQWGVISAH